MLGQTGLREGPMANAERQMPEHVEAAYRDAVDNIFLLKRQQWLATNYVLLLYAAIFLISGHYFSRTDVARNWLGVITIAAFVVHWWTLGSLKKWPPQRLYAAIGPVTALTSNRDPVTI